MLETTMVWFGIFFGIWTATFLVASVKNQALITKIERQVEGMKNQLEDKED